MIKVYDDTVPYHVQSDVYNFIINSMFRISSNWKDRNDVDIAKADLHSPWTLEDLKASKLYPYIEKIHPFDNYDFCMVNLSKPGDYYYTHSHGEGTSIVLYYANLEWQDGWAGETLFYDDQRNCKIAYDYKPGRLLKFDGTEPHSIRPQSFGGPQYRFTVSVFFDARNKDKA